MKTLLAFLSVFFASAQGADFNTVVVENALNLPYCTASTVPIVNGMGNVVSSAVTPTALSYIGGLTSDAQTQINSKGSALSFNSPLVDTSNTVSCNVASGSQAGCIASADWTAFNSKQAAGNYVTALTGDVTASGPGSAVATLATVATPGTSPKVTYNAKGLVTSGTTLSSGDIPNNAANTTGNANTATALASSPTACSTNQYAHSIDTGANLTCSQVAYSQVSGTPTALSFTAPLVNTASTITCNVASGSQPGCIASADWTTFNGKQAAGSYITALTGDGTASGPGSAALTLATVATPGTSPKVTYNAKGLVTSGTTLSSGDIPNNAANTTGNANTATALASAPSQCSGNNWATGVVTSGNANCSQVGFSNLSGHASIAEGGTNETSQTSSGVAYFDGTGITSGSALTWDGSQLGVSGPATFGGQLHTVTDPTSAQDAATKNYVDTVASGLQPIQAVYAATTGSNVAGTYVQIGGCSGDTFTVTATGALSLDGVSPPANSRVLLKDQSTGAQNGVYTVTVAGTTGVSPVLTRATDYNSVSDINAGDLIPVINGTVNATTSWLQTATIVSCGSAGSSLVFAEWTANPASYLLKANNLSDLSSRQTSLNTLVGAVTSGDFLRCNGSNCSIAAIQAADVPTLNQNTSGNAGTATALASIPSQCSGNNWATGIATSGNANCAQLAFSNLSGSATAGQIPTATALAIGGVQIITSAVSHEWISSWNSSGVPQPSQPACGDLSNGVASCSTDTTNASNISSGTLATARLPSPFTSGAASGNTTTFGTTSGSLTSGDCVKFDASGNLVDAGGACSTSSSVATAKTLQNVGLKDSVATNAMTINLTQSDGSTNPSSGGSAAVIAFRSATLTTGSYSLVSVTSSLSIVIPSSATLGQTSAANQYVWVYVLNDAGTPDLCVSGVTYFNEGTTQSATQISSSATSGSVLYCGSSHSGSLPIRFLGRLLVNETTAGTWASAATDVQLNPTVTPNITEPVAYTPTFTNFGAVTAISISSYRTGRFLCVAGEFTVGTAVGSPATMSVGFNGSNANVTIDSTFGNSSSSPFFPQGSVVGNGATAGAFYALGPSGGTTINIGVQNGSNSGMFAANGTTIIANGGVLGANFCVPIKGWSQFGP